MSLQIIRYLALDKCFRSKNRIHSIYELIEACEDAMYDYNPELGRGSISEKQIRNDIKFMEGSSGGYEIRGVLKKKSYNKLSDSKKELVIDFHSQKNDLKGFNPKKTNRKIYYYYKDPNFSIGRKPLTSSDAARISEAILTLKRFKGLPQFEWIEEVSAKLNKFMDKNEISTSAILFDASPYTKSLKWIEPLYKAVINQTPLVLEYQPFHQPSESHKISPYLVKEFNKRWFVLCFTEKRDCVYNLPLDRIISMAEGNHSFVKYPMKGIPDNFFDDIIGVINQKETVVMEIVLSVENSHLPYLITKPLHKSQVVTENEPQPGWTEVVLKIKPNHEFYALILSFGEKVKVMFPDSVKHTLLQKVNKMHLLYK